MFTIKYRSYSRSYEQPSEKLDDNSELTHYDQNEQIHGPFDLISQEQARTGHIVVHAHRGGDPAITFGPILEDAVGQPRPILWVMNEAGATIARYDL